MPSASTTAATSGATDAIVRLGCGVDPPYPGRSCAKQRRPSLSAAAKRGRGSDRSVAARVLLRVRSMRTILLGGAPGVGKSATARALLGRAAHGDRLVQWVDVDNLWLHQPWCVSAALRSMLQANLRAVLANADAARVDIVVVTWVFQGPEMARSGRDLDG